MEPIDLAQCQVNRPNTWPVMPSFMMFGPVVWHRCTNKPTWIGNDGEGSMSLCDKCKLVCENTMDGIKYQWIGEE